MKNKIEKMEEYIVYGIKLNLAMKLLDDLAMSDTNDAFENCVVFCSIHKELRQIRLKLNSKVDKFPKYLINRYDSVTSGFRALFNIDRQIDDVRLLYYDYIKEGNK